MTFITTEYSWECLYLKSKAVIALIIISLLSVMIVSETNATTTLSDDLENPCSGAFLDKVVYDVIGGDDNSRVLALQAGGIDVLYDTIDDIHEDTLDADPDIGLFHTYRSGYGQLTINCRDYPLNISGLRRAFAYAYDKAAVISDVIDFPAIVHDSLVPLPNMWCVEDSLPWNYYAAQSDIGNQILNDLGFTIDGGTGFRLAPNGSAFDIVIEYASVSPVIGGGIAQLAVDALESLHIDASSLSGDFNEQIARLDSHGEYDMLFYAANYPSEDVDWLAYEYWSDYADIAYANPTNFVNATYDSWRDHLLEGTTYEEVYEAASKMQEILHYNVPRLVVYENQYLQAARVDEFTGFVEDLRWGVAGPWTNVKVHNNSDDVFGGTLTVGLSEEIDTFNIFKIDEPLEELITDNLYSSLYKYGPDRKQYPDLTDSVLVETHDTNAVVTSGETWITVHLRRDANWTDGTPLTADDVAFTFDYIQESGAYGNPMATVFSDYVDSVVVSPYLIQIKIDSESWYDIEKYMHAKIIPEHIFEDTAGIGYDGWDTWNPAINGADPHITSGPFYVSDYSSGTYELSRNLDYYWPADEITTTTTGSNSITDNTTTTSGGPFQLDTLTILISVGSITVILVVVLLFYKTKRT